MTKKMVFLSLLCFSFLSHSLSENSDDFQNQAEALVQDLKNTLKKNLTDKIHEKGVEEAISFCHSEVRSLSLSAAQNRGTKYEFGRISHKVRNPRNKPMEGVESYIKEFEGKNEAQMKKKFVIHRLPDGKRIYLSPLYLESKCLLCHGENISLSVRQKIKKLYPEDQATGFRLGEFRGFIWVKER